MSKPDFVMNGRGTIYDAREEGGGEHPFDRDKSLDNTSCPECGAEAFRSMMSIMGRTRMTYCAGPLQMRHLPNCAYRDVTIESLAKKAKIESARKLNAEALERSLEERRVAAMERQAAALERLVGVSPKSRRRK